MLLGALVAALAAFGVSKVLPPVYRATAQLYIAPSTTTTLALQDVILGQNLARTYAQMATGETVLRPAMESLGRSDLVAFAEHTDVSQVRDTSLINITFKDADPQQAADAANAIADAFVKQSRALLSTARASTATELDAQINTLQGEIRVLDQQLSAAAAELNPTPAPGRTAAPVPSARAVVLQAQISDATAARGTKQQSLVALTKTRDDLQLAATRADQTISVWQAAVSPLDPESPRLALNTVAGGMLGGLVALAFMALLIYFDDRLRDADEVRARLGLPLLAHVHVVDPPNTPLGKLFIRDKTASMEAEAFRALRTNILFADVDKEPRSIVVTSAMTGDGKSLVSANLALAFAEAGTSTILIDADLRRPTQHRLFKVPAAYGLTNLLTDRTAVLDLSRFRIGPNLLLIPSGPLPPNPAELLGSARMAQILREIGRSSASATIVLDTAPSLSVSDAITLAARADCCLLVVDASRTHARAARHAMEALEAVHARILGVVLNRTARGASSYYGYEYTAPALANAEREARSPAK